MRPSGNDAGSILKRPFGPSGLRITVNARVRGRITAELRTDDNKPIQGFALADCDEVTQTGFAREFRWKDCGLDKCPTTEVRVLFRLEDADLFTFELTR